MKRIPPIALILALFAAVTALGLFYDYGLSTAGDELPLLSTALKMLGDHTLRPAYPVFYHVALGVYAYLPFLALLLGGLLAFHVFPSVAALKQFVILDYFQFLPLARLITLGASVISIYLTYAIAERLFKERRIALYASAFMATSLLFSYVSHFARVWPLQIAVMLFAFYLIIALYEREENTWKDFTYAGIAIGISFGVHLIGLLIYVPFIVALALRYGLRVFVDARFWCANLAIAVMMLIVFYLNPYGFMNYAHFLNFLINPFANVPVPVDYAPLPAGDIALYYARILVAYDPLLLVFALAGVVFLYSRGRKALLIIGSFIVVYYPVISILGTVPRYIAPAIPFLSLLAGYGVYELTRTVEAGKRTAMVAALFLLLCIPPIMLDAWMLKPSTRSEAVSWIPSYIPAGSRIVLFDRFLPVNEDKQTLADTKKYSGDYTVARAYLDSLDPTLLPAPRYYVLTVPMYTELPPYAAAPEELHGRYDYVILSWWSDKQRNQELKELNTITSQRAELPAVTHFGATSEPLDIANDMPSPLPYLLAGGQSGPTIEVYRLAPAK
ncbi:MAG TPA: glycosyltransferase family 39 protein [Candidatus Paceibacterota bacterium]